MKPCGRFILLGLLVWLSSCNRSSDPSIPTTYPSAQSILGLTRDHQLHYLVFDSIVSYVPYYRVEVDTNEFILTVTRGTDQTVALSYDGRPRDLLAIDNVGVLHSGQIRPDAAPPDTLFYVPTPVIIPQNYYGLSSHALYTPLLMTDSGYQRLSTLFFNYGFFTRRTFLQETQIVLPTSSYTAYRFRAYLFLDDTVADTAMVVDEFYAAEVGLVKLDAVASGMHRLIILLEDD